MQAKLMSEIIAEHQVQVQELTQRIGELCQQVNARDKRIELLEFYRTAYLSGDTDKQNISGANDARN